MKILKSFASLKRKRKGGMSKPEEDASYEQYSVYPNPNSKEGDPITIHNDTTKNDETFYCWKFYEENDPEPNHEKKRPAFHFGVEEEQERYEWFCAGWVSFYDKIVRPKAVPTTLIKPEHKLFFFWDNNAVPGVAIYVDDANAVNHKDVDIVLTYTPATATGDPPTIPPPPPPSGK